MNQGGQTANHALLALAWFSAGIIFAGLFWTAQLPPLRATILFLFSMTFIALVTLRTTELSILTRLYVILFTLPFGATFGYLFDNDYVWWQTPTNILLCQNHRLINEMLTMVIVGLCGLVGGIEFTAMYICRPGRVTPPPPPTAVLTLPVTWILLAVSFLFSWLHAPEASIFVAAYASSDAGGGMDKEAGLNASYLISYMILILVLVDAEQERPGRRRTLKFVATLAVFAYIVLILQLLRGDRECAGLVAAIVMLYITNAKAEAARQRLRRGMEQVKRLMKLAVPLTVCLLAFLALGSVRHTASQSNAEKSTLWQMVCEGATANTWTAVALNNLGLSADYNYGNIEYLYGRTYLDYFLSLPPGTITKILGYERPLEGDANPAMWYFGLIAAGGMHPVVVPFRNLGIFGVLGFMTLCGWFLCKAEVYNETGTLPARLLYGCLGTSSMLWFWYGDMNMIRTLMGWGILYGIHLFSGIPPEQSYRQAPRFSASPRTPLPRRTSMPVTT